eukprot:6299899-Amphidinium_carterae.1
MASYFSHGCCGVSCNHALLQCVCFRRNTLGALLLDRGVAAAARRRKLADASLEASLADIACQYVVHGCGLEECSGVFEYAESSSHGAPVYKNTHGWTLHRGRPPVVETLSTDC